MESIGSKQAQAAKRVTSMKSLDQSVEASAYQTHDSDLAKTVVHSGTDASSVEADLEGKAAGFSQLPEETQKAKQVIEGLKCDETPATTRPFGRKFWAYFKQANPLVNSWRYYLRLQPRWTRACYLLIAFQANLLVVQADSSPLGVVAGALAGYFGGLYGAPLAFSLNVNKCLEGAKSQRDVIRNL